jgi:hypothetical protein
LWEEIKPAMNSRLQSFLTVEEVQAVLETLDVTPATVPDVPARLLKETALVISTTLCTLLSP